MLRARSASGYNRVMEIPIIYEDDRIVVVNKPAGLVVHADGRTKEATLADWVAEHYPAARDVGEPLVLASGEEVARPGIVHRLDRETSGVLVIAKDQESFQFLKEQFQERSTEKTYRVFLYGEMKDRRGEIDLPIGKSKSDFRRWLASDNARGTLREAHTEYQVLAHGHGASYAEAYPKTGRTHQIRVHFKAVGHPVIGDTLYAPKKEALLGFTRMALHAWRLSIALPGGGRATFEAPLPEDFEQAEREIRAS